MIEGLLALLALLIIPVTAGVWSGRQIDLQRSSPESIGLRIIAIVVGMCLCVCVLVIVREERAMAEFAASHAENPRAIAASEYSLANAVLGGMLQGIALGLLLGVPAGLVAVAAQRITIRLMGDRVKSGHCYSCGYDLTGNVSGRCPECGSAVAKRGPAAADE